MADIGQALSKKVGPFPVGVWLALLAAGAGIGLYMSRTNSSGSQTEVSSTDLDDLTGVTAEESLSGEGPGWTYVPPPVDSGEDADLDETPKYATVKEWEAAAIAAVLANASSTGDAVDSLRVQSVIHRYVSKQPITTAERAIVNQAIQLIGQPPGNYLGAVIANPITAGGTTKTPAKPAPAKQKNQVARPGTGNAINSPSFPDSTMGATSSRWYKIERGDNIGRIAVKMYGRNSTANVNKIYNANKQGKNRPGPTKGFLNNRNDVGQKDVGRWLWIPGPVRSK